MLQPTPGVVLIKPKKEMKGLSLSMAPTKRIIAGEVLAVGPGCQTKFGADQAVPCNVGDTVYFLTYEGNYDQFYHENQLYFAVDFLDIKIVEPRA